MLKSGCYENVFQISGALQQFISRCVVGGGVMTNSNKMYHVKRKSADLDACSLYPSAMYFMVYPRVAERIIKLNKHLDFPLTSKIGETGVRVFITDMENEIID